MTSSSTLDAATGAMRASAPALRASVTIVDISSQALERAKELVRSELGKVTAIESDGNPLALPEGFATRVISTEVLEHVDDPLAFTRELVRIGRVGCVYLLSVPDTVGEEIQKHVAPDFYFQKPNHIRIFQRDEFARLVEDAGLIIDRRAYYGFYWAMYWSMIWPLGVCGPDPRHLVLDNWVKTWAALLDSPAGPKVQELLNNVMPKNQVIIAHKPVSREA
jgi:SAM-dependent methyltransferase